MPFAVWKDCYSLGDELIDEQHKSLIAMLNDLAEAESEDVAEAAYTCLSRMGNYAREHFRAEEALMREKGYPDLAKHIAEHTEFINKVVEYQDAVFNKYVPFQDMLEFLNNWLVGHIITSDQKYMDYIRSL